MVGVWAAPANPKTNSKWQNLSQEIQQILKDRPPNLQLLEDHAGVLDPDGIHFNIMSGINYVQDLHDQAVQLSLMPPPDPKLR